ncbi:MAG: hypothetical protein OEY49_03725 [Candidatus Heimdallarchaeota archaeon]|nr:hypothetical protein [Candidatus Heimdallarchaeota archaeon]
MISVEQQFRQQIILPITIMVCFIFYFIGNKVDPDYFMVFYLIVGLIVTFVIYRFAYLKMQVIEELDDDSKKTLELFYDSKELKDISLKNGKVINFVIISIIFLSVYTIIVLGLNEIKNVFSDYIQDLLFQAQYVLIFGFLLFIFVVYAILIINSIRAWIYRIEEEYEVDDDITSGESLEYQKFIKQYDSIFRFTKSDKALFLIVLITFVLISVYTIIQYEFSIQGIILTAALLPLIFITGRLEGRFFYLFTINQWFLTKNWDMLSEEKIWYEDQSKTRKLLGRFKQLFAFITLILVPLSILSTLLSTVDFFFINEGNTVSEGIFSNLSISEYYIILLIASTSGPLLLLFLKPFGFVSTWVNKPLYDKLSSNWGSNYRKTGLILANRNSSFYGFVLLVGSISIFSMIIWKFIANMQSIFKSSFLIESLIISNLLLNLILLFSIIELTIDLVEEKTIFKFGNFGNIYSNQKEFEEYKLINKTLVAEYFAQTGVHMFGFLKRQPVDWALFQYFKGENNLEHTKTERKEAYYKAIEMGLIPGALATTYINLGYLHCTEIDDSKEREEIFRERTVLASKIIEIDQKDYRIWRCYGTMHFYNFKTKYSTFSFLEKEQSEKKLLGKEVIRGYERALGLNKNDKISMYKLMIFTMFYFHSKKLLITTKSIITLIKKTFIDIK